jgi:crotonobetainyl-CoA:carnitine CoA-transferase CaiB-like acyl-CoA transferase
MKDLLSGTRILDLTNALAGSSATKILADLGADVIKIENPVAGDYTRTLMPYIFQAHNRNKRSFAVNLKAPGGASLVKRLAATCDVFVQSMRPGAAERYGLSRADLAEANPRLIYASLSAFGAVGPQAHRRGVDGVVQAESGLAAVQNRVLGNTSFLDAAAGLALSQAILIALMTRDRTGVVKPIDVSLLDTAVYLQAAPLAEFSVTGAFIDQTAYDARYPAVGVYQASDGPFYMAPYWERNWLDVCRLLGLRHLTTDPRFADKAVRGAHNEELRALFGERFAKRPKAEWIRELEALGVLAGEVQGYAGVLADPQLSANRSLERHVLDTGETATFPRPPFRFAGEPLASARPAPALGVDTDDLLGEVGVGQAERDRLRMAGVIGPGNALVCGGK